MTTTADLLKKAESKRKVGQSFQPQKRRAWDYLSADTPETIDSVYFSSKEYRDKYRDSEEQISEQNRYENENKSEHNRNEYRNNKEQIWEQSKDNNGNNNKYKIQAELQKKQERILKNLSASYDETAEAHIIKVLRKTAGYQRDIMEQLTAHVKSLKEIPGVINIPISELSNRINVDKDIVRTSIKRLQKKSILLKTRGERGRHGSTYVAIPNFVIKECFNIFNCAPCLLEETGYKNRNKIGNEEILYSSSNINKTTTTEAKNVLPENWLAINIEPLKEIGFSLNQLQQLNDKSLNIPEIIQESINHFSFGLQYSPKVKSYEDPLNVLMGVLRKGQAWFEKNYQSPQEIAQRQLIEIKKAEMERIKKLEEEAYKIALDEWKTELSEEKIEEIISKHKKPGDITPKIVRINAYFRANIWHLKKKDFLIKEGK